MNGRNIRIVIRICPNVCRRENIIEELLNTEMNYVDDLKLVLAGYRDKLEMSQLSAKLSALR